MGVTGLWRLIEPAGKPVPVETLENKVLAVDISIWLHQMVKGYQDTKGAPLPNAHLMGLFQRLCKLLYFRIKPVFVFDGGFPDLKKETIARRQDNKARYNTQSEKLKREIALLLGKKTAINALLGKDISPKKNKQSEDKDDIFKLPALPEKVMESESESDDEESPSSSVIDLHSVDLESEKFKNLPIKEKYDVLIELKETRKMNSWGKIHTLPKKSDNFSEFQMQRLLKRRKVQECLEDTEKEMGDGGMSLTELESLLNEEGIDTKLDSIPGRRIASNNSTRYLLISNVKQALVDAKQKQIEQQTQTQKQIEQQTQANSEMSLDEVKKLTNKNELEDDLQKAIKMSLECVDLAETSGCTSKTDDSWTSFLTDSDYSDDENHELEQPDISSAKAYIMQYTDFTHNAIDHIVATKQKGKEKYKEPTVNKIIEELNQENTIIEDNIDVTYSDEDVVEKSMNNNYNIDVNASKFINYEKDPSDNITQPEKKILLLPNKHEKCNENDTQLSVVCVENSLEEIDLLNTSTEDSNHQNFLQVEKSQYSESSEGDFEEVSDNEETRKKPSIQLTLNMGNEVKDDIFADIFSNKDDTKLSNILSKSSSTEKCDNLVMEHNLKNNSEECRENDEKTTEKFQSKIKVVDNDLSLNSTKIPENEIQFGDRVSPKFNNVTSENIVDESYRENRERINKVEIPVEKLNSLVSEIENEEEDLIQERGRLDRIGRNITQQMTKEAQELLRVFGIPYIVAPMEAEAQCAFLENVKLTDGTITDDSDIWLFGGKTVYKNFFNQKKHVLQFLGERIEKSFHLSRENLVLLALLVGSDYTTGVTGVGPVTALEILASFPFAKRKIPNEDPKQNRYQDLVEGLQEFKKWTKAGRRTDNISLKKKLKNVNLSDDFPSLRVVQAYMEPNVEKSEEKFSWGELDITILRDYTKAKFGWSQNKLDEIIKPVLKRMLDRKSQRTMSDYFKRKLEFQSLENQLSKRVIAAVQKMEPGKSVPDIIEPDNQKNKRKRKIKTDPCKEKYQQAKHGKHADETKNIDEIVKSVVVDDKEGKIDINISRSGRFQEIIPQREKDKKNLLENKLKAIELFRKTKIDRKKKASKRKLPVPKEKAALSESDSD